MTVILWRISTCRRSGSAFTSLAGSKPVTFGLTFTDQDADRIRTGAEELITLSPNVIIVWANPAVAILPPRHQDFRNNAWPEMLTLRPAITRRNSWRLQRKEQPLAKLHA